MLADVLIKVAAEQAKEEGRSAYRPRPSSAGPERCVRAMTYHALGAEPAPLAGRAILVFDDSSWHEELTADWINKTAFRLHSRQMGVTLPGACPWLGKVRRTCGLCVQTKAADPTRADEDLHGHIDGIITDILGVDRLWEHKAINHFSFERVWNGEFPADYFTQCAIYIKALQRVNPAINEALLLVKNKNTAQYLEFLLRYDAANDTLRIVEMVRSDGERQTPEYEYVGIVQDALDKFATVESFRAQNKLPARPYEFGSDFPCSYCAWNRACWENFAAEFNDLPTEAQLDIEEMVTRFQAVKGEEAEAKKEKDALREQILGKLALMGVKGGRAGRYLVTAKVVKRAGFTVEPSEFIQLNVTAPKEAKNAKAA